MSDFVKVVRDWRRMCKSYSNTGGCGTCPLQENDTCANIETATDDDITNAEHIIEEWCEKNPELVYLTWAEWLIQMGILERERFKATIGGFDCRLVHATMPAAYKSIPADVAKKLGIEPKMVRRS